MKACADGSVHLQIWRKDRPEERLGLRYACHSLRHPGECQRWKSQQTYDRITEALEPIPLERLSFIVLSLDPKRVKDLEEAFRKLNRKWNTLARRLMRRYGNGRRDDYVATLEAHKRTGWPHINVILVSEHIHQLAARHAAREDVRHPKAVEAFWRRKAKAAGLTVEEAKAQFQRKVLGGWTPPVGERPPERQKAPRWFKEWACSAGFGWSVSLQPVRSKDGAASYLAKAAEQTVLHPLGGEVSKTSQVPYAAPAKTRFLRSSKGFLPPTIRNEESESEWTGKLVHRPLPEAHQVEPTTGEVTTVPVKLEGSLAQALDRELGRFMAELEPDPDVWTLERSRSWDQYLSQETDDGRWKEAAGDVRADPGAATG